MLTEIIGDLGSGKTLLCTYFIWKNQDIPAFCNYNVRLDNAKKLELDNIITMTYSKAIIAVDELYAIIDSRSSMSHINKYFSYFLFQSRKRGVDILATAQLMSSIDIRYRELANLTILALGKTKEGFNYDLIRRSINGYQVSSFLLSFEIAEKIYPLYDTFEIVKPEGLDELQAEVQSPEKLNREIENITKEIINRKEEFGLCDFKKISQKKIDDILLQMGKPEFYAHYISSRLEQKLNE